MLPGSTHAALRVLFELLDSLETMAKILAWIWGPITERGGTKDDDAYYFFVLLLRTTSSYYFLLSNFAYTIASQTMVRVRDCRGYVSREDLFIYLFLREEKNPNNVGNVSLPDSKRRNAAVSHGSVPVCVRSRDLTRCSFVRKTCIFVRICLFILFIVCF